MTECNAIPCSGEKEFPFKRREATHTVTIKVIKSKGVPEWLNEIEYCLTDAMYFAAWLPYCYPGEYELISIMPPAAELFNRG